ncbi:MAG: hypothetical protein KDC35_09070 [Acidobacteria bacterium]|nr:hypothetical protein [Acidobacteriota bacterium]
MRITIFLALMVSPALAQDYLDNILRRNPFDPDRGQVVETPQEDVAPVIQNLGMPTLDGTIIIGEIKYALFTYTEEGRPKSSRFRVNETIQGYTVVEVSREAVQLKGSNDRPILVTMYSDKKKNRGGTKAAVGGREARERAMRAAEPEIITTRSESEQKDDKKRESRFQKRETPPAKQPAAKPEDAKKSSMDNKI